MTIKYKIFKLCVFLVLLLSICGCGFVRDAVNNIDLKKPLTSARPELDTILVNGGRDFSSGLNDNATKITKSLISGLKGSIDTLDPDIKKLEHWIDSLGNLTNAQVKKITDSLDIQLGRLKGDITDPKLKDFLVSTVEAMTGKLKSSTKGFLGEMIIAALDTVNAPSGKAKLYLLISNLLSDSNSKVTQKFIYASLQPTVDSLAAKIDNTVNRVHDEIGFVQKYAWQLLFGVGVLACAIIAFVWYERKRYSNLVGLLTYQIHKIPSRASYDEITQGIQSEAQRTGLEPLLRKSLKTQGLNT